MTRAGAALRPVLFGALLVSASVPPACGHPAAPAPALWGSLVPGPYPVGTRRLDTPRGAVHVWYPSAATGEGLRVRDYLDDGGKGLSTFLTGAGLPPSTADSLLESRLLAASGLPPLDTPRPLILVAEGNGQDAVDQVVVCEYLASRGLVVAATPSPMIATPLEREDQVGPFAGIQAADLEAAVHAVAAALPVDTERLGAVGHSFGARAALLLAMQDRRVRALVSLDGGIGTATAAASFRSAPSFRAGARIPPILHFYETLDEFMTPDFGLLRSLHARRLDLVPTAAMHHAHFTTYGFAVGLFPSLAAVTHAGPATAGEASAVAERAADFLLRRLQEPRNRSSSGGSRDRDRTPSR